MNWSEERSKRFGLISAHQDTREEDLAVIGVDALGLGIHFPRLDAGFYVPALLEGVLGCKSWIAAWSDAHQGRFKKMLGQLLVQTSGR